MFISTLFLFSYSSPPPLAKDLIFMTLPKILKIRMLSVGQFGSVNIKCTYVNTTYLQIL